MTETRLTPGHVVWRELMTPDINSAKAFYQEVLGWSFAGSASGSSSYPLARCGEKEVAGLMLADDPPAGSWGCYFCVADAAATAEAAVEAGGTLLQGPLEIPGMGLLAALRDPEDTPFMIIQPEGPASSGPASGEGEPCWETLYTSALASIAPFYAEVLDLRLNPKGMGGAPLFETDHGMVADIDTPPAGVPSHWLSWFIAPGGVEATCRRALAAGGAVLQDPIPVPGVGRIAILVDRQGATFGIVESE